MKPHETISKIKLKAANGLTPFEPARIVHFKADGNYVLVYEADKLKPVKTQHKLKDIEELIVEKDLVQFFKCHRSHIVNLDHILRFNEKARILITEHGEIPLSEELLDDFKDIFCK
jgi:two-component system, LytTR family, response regulator